LKISQKGGAVANFRWQTASFKQLRKRELYAALRLRQEVFAVEQNSAYLDLDNLDQLARHILCWEKDELLAYQRCLPPGVHFPESALGRIVVNKSARGNDLGRELVRRGVDHNLERWPGAGLRINAQSYLTRFYRELGFVTDGEEYGEDGIPHIQMVYAPSG
jgi:ElaA protein